VRYCAALQLLANPGGGGFNQLLARLEMLISGATVDARALRDLGDTEAFLAILSQHFSRRLENCLTSAIMQRLRALRSAAAPRPKRDF
jgi:hypothetical protein